MARKSLFLFAAALIVAMVFCPTSNAKAFDIGWGFWGGWTPHSWIETQEIHVGDTIDFYYDPDYDNLLQVTRENYETCNRKNPIALWADSKDLVAVFHVTEYGHFYFISGEHGQCEGGMKVHIYIPNPNSFVPVQSPTAEAPAPSSSSTPTAPAPSSSSFSG